MKTLKTWTRPEVIAVEQMKNAQNGSHNGLAKGPLLAEYSFDGPGS